MLRAKNLVKRYQRRAVVDGVSLELETGEVVGLAPEPVGDPRTNRSGAWENLARIDVKCCWTVIVVVHLDAEDECQIIGARGNTREQRRNACWNFREKAYNHPISIAEERVIEMIKVAQRK